MDKSRRRFIKKNCLGDTIKLISGVQKSFNEALTDTDYFDSHENCYPLISEYSYFLEDEVKELGIDVTGKSKQEIVEMVYERKKGGRDDGLQ